MTAKFSTADLYDRMQDNLEIRQARRERMNNGEENSDDSELLEAEIDDLCTALTFLNELLDKNIKKVTFSADDYQRYLID